MASPGTPRPTGLRYDAVLKDLFQRDHPTLLRRLSGGMQVKQTLNVELAIVEERRADLLFELEDDSLFLLDLQSTNDRNMAYRIGVYTLVGAQKYKRKIRAVVLYTGMAKMRMESQVDAGSAKVDYQLVDIREIGAETLLGGGPGDLALALLARGGARRLREILMRAMKFESPRRERLLTQLIVLAGLRHLDKKITMEMKQMGAYIDIQKHYFLRDVFDKGLAEGEARGEAKGEAKGEANLLSTLLEEKFGPLPAWARARLKKARPEQRLEWTRKLLMADSLAGVIGRR